jgi:hypothetical protein
MGKEAESTIHGTVPDNLQDMREGAIDHIRNYSLLGFQESASARTALTVRNELEKLIATCPEEEKKKFSGEMSSFHELFSRYVLAF